MNSSFQPVAHFQWAINWLTSITEFRMFYNNHILFIQTHDDVIFVDSVFFQLCKNAVLSFFSEFSGKKSTKSALKQLYCIANWYSDACYLGIYPAHTKIIFCSFFRLYFSVWFFSDQQIRYDEIIMRK